MRTTAMLCLFLLSICICLHGHEGHHVNMMENDNLKSWLNSIGRFHLIFLHFPIALITMTVAAEILWVWFRNPLFDQAARFMLISAAIFVIPTVLLGWAFSYGQQYEGLQLELYEWHRYFGCLTAALAILATFLRERYRKRYTSSLTAYYICLFFLFISVSLTGTFGGSLAFGIGI